MGYTIGGTYLASCNCRLLCPCPVDGTPTGPNDECHGAAAFRIDTGNLDGVDLAGVKFALLNHFPSNITSGNWKMGIVVDAGSDEQAQAVEQMIKRGYTSHGKVGITGCSYGGYFTTQSIARYPNLYAAANTQCTLLDLFTEWQIGFTPILSYLEGRPPTTDPDEYKRDSPIYNATQIRTPLLIFDGTFDFLPVTISGNLHDQVAANKTTVKFLKFRGEGHGLHAKNSQTTAAQAQIAWFRQYLAGNKKP